MASLNLLAMDYGASNGRGMIGQFDGRRVSMHAVHRFNNTLHNVHGVLYWNVLQLFENAKLMLAESKRRNICLDSFGIDTWAVDYGLLDCNGNMLGNVLSYRNSVDADMAPVWGIMGRRNMFDRTGIAHLCFNTIYQLYRRSKNDDVALAQAKTLLFLPDLLAYFLTGEKGAEYTVATTSMLYDPAAGNWAYDMIEKLQLSKDIFPQIQPSGTLRGRLLSSVAEDLGMPRVPFVAVGEHDTASAVAAIPGSGDFAFCSSGTWSLFGVETNSPILSDQVYDGNFSNEGTVQGGCRPLKNIMGLWIIQECRRDWQKKGMQLSWDDIVQAAEMEAPLRSIVDVDAPEFFASGGMEQKIQAYCQRTKQPVPQNVGEVTRCVYESLALKYRWALERLGQIKGGPISSLNIVGGGTQNRLLNQMAADATGRMVITGPTEGAAMGNILMQAVALGELKGIDDMRAVVRASVETGEYLPRHTQAWQDAYEKLRQIMEAPV